MKNNLPDRSDPRSPRFDLARLRRALTMSTPRRQLSFRRYSRDTVAMANSAPTSPTRSAADALTSLRQATPTRAESARQSPVSGPAATASAASTVSVAAGSASGAAATAPAAPTVSVAAASAAEATATTSAVPTVSAVDSQTAKPPAQAAGLGPVQGTTSPGPSHGVEPMPVPNSPLANVPPPGSPGQLVFRWLTDPAAVTAAAQSPAPVTPCVPAPCPSPARVAPKTVSSGEGRTAPMTPQRVLAERIAAALQQDPPVVVAALRATTTTQGGAEAAQEGAAPTEVSAAVATTSHGQAAPTLSEAPVTVETPGNQLVVPPARSRPGTPGPGPVPATPSRAAGGAAVVDAWRGYPTASELEARGPEEAPELHARAPWYSEESLRQDHDLLGLYYNHVGQLPGEIPSAAVTTEDWMRRIAVPAYALLRHPNGVRPARVRLVEAVNRRFERTAQDLEIFPVEWRLDTWTPRSDLEYEYARELARTDMSEWPDYPQVMWRGMLYVYRIPRHMTCG